MFNHIATGWLCPRCQRINAPHVQACFCRPSEGTTAPTTGPLIQPPGATTATITTTANPEPSTFILPISNSVSVYSKAQ